MTRRFRRGGGVLLGFRRKKVSLDRLAEFTVTARRLEQERALAGNTVDRLLRATPRADWPALAERPELLSAGALERLGNTVAVLVTQDPIEALAVAELAVAAAEGIHPQAYPGSVVPQLRAHAWKDLGKALRFLGRNREALDAFDKAERLLDGHTALGHDRAIVWLHRALSLQELEMFEESRVLLAESKAIFIDHNDVRNATFCASAEGAILQRRRQYREAREIYLLLFTTSRDMDAETRAALHRRSVSARSSSATSMKRKRIFSRR